MDMDKAFRQSVEAALRVTFNDYLDRKGEFNHTALLKGLATFCVRVGKVLTSIKQRSEADELVKFWEYEKGLFEELCGREKLPPISFPHFPEPAKSAPNKKAKISESCSLDPVPLTFINCKLVENDLIEAPDVGMATGGQVSLVGTGSDLEKGAKRCILFGHAQ